MGMSSLFQREQGLVIIGGSTFSSAANAELFFAWGSFSASADEALTNMICQKALRLRRVQVGITTNTKDEDSIFAVRRNGVNIGAITIPSSDPNRKVDSGALNIPIAAGDLCNVIVDTATSTLGNLAVVSYQLEFTIR